MHHGALTLSATLFGAAIVAFAATCVAAHSVGYLIDETFRVVTIEGNPAAAEQTLAFAVDGTVRGSTGCNTFSTGIRVDGHEMSIGNPRLTRRACPAPLMDAERAFLDALAKVGAFEIELDDNRLILFDTAGVAELTLTRVPR
ncbi:META domain-containing protein [Acuticoccus sp. MNP-M23]|uniref:META domain-containing protein n=1 Tax=Acuticoccus sp. MNP-M23 TaxID=3072793 RepID=UPI00281519C8|nr:META domain-containing protein [Acuticoccus sp. MNP-M23]WMS40809.1 META domain-containing protein [Acuticoccus sp. MNP-M23]